MRLGILLTLVVAVVTTVIQTLPPAALPTDAPDDQFSAGRALRHIQAIAGRPHPTGSMENAVVREYILAELRAMELDTETQADGSLVNILGRIPGSSSRDAVLLTAHYDSTIQSPGAADDASGVAVLLETARALLASGPANNSIILLFTDSEEGGFFGAKAFINHHPWAKDVRVVIGFDAGGLSGPGVLSATSPNNGWLIGQLAKADPTVVGSSAINGLATSNTDFGRAFKSAGFSGYAFDFYWDKSDGPDDNLGVLNLAGVQHQGYHALALARQLGNLKPLADPKQPDLVYFSVLRLMVVNYAQPWAILLAFIGLCIFGAALAYGLRRRILAWSGLGYGVSVCLGSFLIAPLPVVMLEVIARSWFPGASSLYDFRLLDQPPQMAAFALSSLALILLWYTWVYRIRKTSLPDQAAGALIPMAAAVVVTAMFFPALSYGFAWPFIFSTLAISVWLREGAQSAISGRALISFIASGVICIVVIGPAIVLGLFDQPSMTMVFLAVLAGFLLPQISLITGARR